MTEAEHQKIVVQYLRKNNIMHFAPMNENIGSFLDRLNAVKLANKAKGMGSIKGTPDLVIMLPKCILFLELKKEKGHVSKEQNNFLGRVNNYSYAVGEVAFGHQEAIQIIMNLR